MNTNPIRVLLVEGQIPARRGWTSLLLGFIDMVVVGEAQDGAQALDLCSTTQPDIVLMDLAMPDMDGAEFTNTLREQFPGIQVIALINFEEYNLLKRALNAGISGILVKSMDGHELASKIRRVHSGQEPFVPSSIEDLLCAAQIPDTSSMEAGSDLTGREIEVLELMARGLTNPQISKELIISRATVKAHVSNILGKLGVTTRTQAVAQALQIHLIDGPGSG